ncbi:NADP-dependent phosphogluconate dehydrogenase [Parenemella sanctibonifatiensis]|uniref:6-phosphogluconate dehydrogenase, decarboxylating n=1 Tax=Parenemella sanctibonifatiensis TaxID=2016505 RepID=A0A255EH72_9ACTN|nr:NADP-dependent phosphogluconate dehydrogenase [Parenemella sanctibonifatiensis]OYN90887.1 phosphogluconate dehydrogenase (NADP(+)-dependent, decarboxylating) [Parenemella sanctibonifatiensis]
MSNSDLAQVGVVGLAVMGSNLARNFASKGHSVALFNRTQARTDELMADHGQDGDFRPATTVEEFVASLERPRRIIIMVKAGDATDKTIESLLPHLEEGDIVVDGGNAHYADTRRREEYLRGKGLHFVGAGISGGEEGALNGPSIMPGGSPESYAALGPLLENISAKYDGEPCCAYIGTDGAGHFVKMVHNGIEYADMQFIAEAYDVLRAAGLDTTQIADVFAEWNTGDLDSFLIEITAKVLRKADPVTGKPLVDVILDQAGQKGTGRWTVQIALELGVPVNTIGESVFARSTSSHPDLREACRNLPGPSRDLTAEQSTLVEDVRQALWASKVVAYAQGLDQIRTAAKEYGWEINIAEVAKIWRAGCIIRARLLERIRSEYAENNLTTLLEAPSIVEGMGAAQDGWRRTVAQAVQAGIPTPGFSAALGYYDSVRAERLPAALIQAQRDYFGAHTYQRVDGPGTFHIEWTADGSQTQQA